MAHYLRGELKPPKRKRGQKRLSYLTTLEDVHESIMQDAVLDYHHIMSEVQKEYGSKYNVKFKAVEYVADRDGIDYEALLNRINRPKNNGEISGVDNVPHAVRLFHKWLHRTGRLRNYPRYVGSGALVKAGILATRQADREKDKAD